MARNFSNWLKHYMHYTRDSEAPDEFHFWTGVATIAGALRRRVWIDMRKFQWTPNFYIILVGPPGIVTKSTTTRIGLRLLGKVDGIKFGPQSMTWQALTAALEDSVEYVEWDEGGKKKQLAHSSLTISVPELGTLLRMDDSSLVDVLVSMWDGQLETWGHDTKSSGKTKVVNPWLNIIGATTPSWIQGNFPEHMIGGGLASRMIFIYGERKRHLIAFPDEISHGSDYYRLEDQLIADLKEIAKLKGPYELTKEARTWGKDWYVKLWDERPTHMASDRYSGYISRKQTHIMKLAMVVAAAKRNDLVIGQDDLEEADKLLTLTEPHMTKVFESVGVVDEAKHVAEIVGYVRNYKKITANDLFYLMRNTISERDFKAAVRLSVEGGLLAIVHEDGKRLLALAGKRTIN